LEVLREALSVLPANDYQIWLQVGMALKSDLQDVGYELWFEWSKTGSNFDGDLKTAQKWNSFKKEGLGVGTIFYLAKQYGWKPPRRTNYQVVDGAIHYLSVDKKTGEPTSTPLCNFNCRINECRSIDDGISVKKMFRVSGATADGVPLPTIDVEAEKLTGMWWLAGWNGRAIVSPGIGMTYLWNAILELSQPIPVRTIYAHLGWRQIDEKWIYLHAGRRCRRERDGARGRMPSGRIAQRLRVAATARPGGRGRGEPTTVRTRPKRRPGIRRGLSRPAL
jgi:hypothetical protein